MQIAIRDAPWWFALLGLVIVIVITNRYPMESPFHKKLKRCSSIMMGKLPSTIECECLNDVIQPVANDRIKAFNLLDPDVHDLFVGVGP